MPDLPDIDELIKDLDPAAKVVVKILVGLVEEFRAFASKLEAENAELKRMLFGQKSERLVMPPVKREVARRAKAAETEDQKAARKAAAKKKREERKEARKNLPTVEEKIAVPEDEQQCGACGGAFRDLGEGLVTELYEWVPAKIIRKRVVRQKKVCRCGDTIVTAPPAPQVTEGWS